MDRKERVKFWRVPEMGIELLHAQYITHAFCRHTHDTYAIAAIEQGAEAFFYRGETHVAPTGGIALVNPGEVHTGQAATKSGWTYRVLYPPPSLLQRIASEVSGRRAEMPYFSAAVIEDRELAQAIALLHQSLEGGQQLEKDDRLWGTLATLVTRHAGNRPSLTNLGQEKQPIQRVRDYLDAHSRENVSLEQLAAIAHLSPFYLLRSFRTTIGLPPHSYLTQVRVTRAKKLLRQGLSITEVSQETGFADQSHLTRQFKRIVGVTPGQYSKVRNGQ